MATIQLETLSAIQGDTKAVFSDVDPEDRKALAEKVNDLKKGGCTVFLEYEGQTFLIEGYDSVTNEWILKTTRAEKEAKKSGRRVKASGTKATPVAPTSGG
jgi:hypothetical protein